MVAYGNSFPAFVLEQVTKTFYPILPFHRHRAVTAVRELSLQVPRGSVFTLLGPNGAGKSTTIKMIAGLILPTSGRILFLDNKGMPLKKRPRIGAVLEGTRNIYWRLSPLENLRYFGELKGIPLPEISRQSRKLLEEFGLSERANASAQTLSRGMQQKVALAVALMGDPEILLLDEPTLGLDVESSLSIRKKLRQLAEREGKCIVLTTHQMDLAASVSDRIGIIYEGKLVAEDSITNLTHYFRRSDFELEISAGEWERLKPKVSTFKFTLEPSREEGVVIVTFHLEASQDFYTLLKPLSELNVSFYSLRQVSPSLEEVFLEITQAQKVSMPKPAVSGGSPKGSTVGNPAGLENSSPEQCEEARQ